MGGLINMEQKWLSWYDVGPTIWPLAMALTLDFKGQNLKKLYPWSGMAD